ncbi:MAG: hypothetical protein ACJ76V_10715 [Thermoleophilaceae bacterium]
MQYRQRRHVIRHRIIDAEVMKLELRAARVRVANAGQASAKRTRPSLAHVPTRGADLRA